MEQIKNETVEVVDVVVSDQEKDQIRERCEREAKRAEAIIAKEKTDALQEQIDTLERRKDRLHRLLEPVLTMNFASGAEFTVLAE
jgi:predicted  nucleic acid-binding Zn-ribbon protein